MTRIVTMLVLAFALTFCPACNKTAQTAATDAATVAKSLTPEQIKAIGTQAGTAAAKIWLTSAKPTAKGVEDVKAILIDIRDGVGGYAGGSFLDAMPVIEKTIKAKIEEPALQTLAIGLSQASLVALDLLFADHADWKIDGNKSAVGVQAFCDAAKKVLDGYKGK